MSQKEARWVAACREKGRKARNEDLSKSKNPYTDDLSPVGKGRWVPNFNRARWRAWNEGWDEENARILGDSGATRGAGDHKSGAAVR